MLRAYSQESDMKNFVGVGTKKYGNDERDAKDKNRLCVAVWLRVAVCGCVGGQIYF